MPERNFFDKISSEIGFQLISIHSFRTVLDEFMILV